MGALHTLTSLFSPRSAEDVRADLAKAEAAHVAAVEAGDRKAADDAAWEVSQVRLAVGRAEAREAEARAEAAAKALAVRRAGIAAAVARIETTPAFVAATVAEVADIGARLAKLQQAILANEDQCLRDARFVQDECRAIGDAMPVIRNDAPIYATGVMRTCAHAVRARNVADGVSHRVEQSAADLVRGTTL